MYIRSRYASTYQSSGASNNEHTPLVQVTPPNRKKKIHLRVGHQSHPSVITLCFVLVLGILFGVIGACINQSLSENILDPDVRERIQREWNIKVKEHQRFMEHAREEEDQWKEKMDEEKEDWHRKEQQWQREWNEMQRRAGEKAEDWHRKEQQWQREWNEMQRRAGEEAEDWHRKEQQWQREWNEMQRRAREEAERAEKEKRDREHMNLYWEDIRAEEKCTAHRTKKYSARLANLLPGIDALDACKATALTLHGVTYDSPLYCEDRESNESRFEFKQLFRMPI